MQLGTKLDTTPLTIDDTTMLILRSPETLTRMFLDAAHEGKTVSYFGDANAVVPFLPKDRTHDTVLFEVYDDRPVGFNPLKDIPTANLVPDAIEAAYPSTVTTTQLHRYLIPACLALVEASGTIFQLPYLYSSPQFRARVLGMIKDPVIRHELEDFDAWTRREQHDQTNSLDNRFTVIKTDKAVRRILSQKRDLKQPGILIVDLPQGDRFDLVTALLMSQMQGVSFIARPLLHVGPSIPIMACNYLHEMPDALREKMVHTAVIMAARLGVADAKTLEAHFAVDPGNSNLIDIPDGQALVRLQKTIQIHTHAHSYPARPGNFRRLRNQTKQWYGTPATTVDGNIERYMEGL
jgi:hypothetical protein